MTSKPEVNSRSPERSDIIRPAWGREEDGFTKILFGAIRLIRCCGACDRQGDFFLRFKLGGIYGLGIKVKRGCHLGVAQQPLNRLHVLAPANQKRRKGMTEVVKSESLTGFQSNADLEGGGANLVCRHDART
jgi:hypothetical protein